MALRSLLGVMINDTEGETRAPPDPAYPMAQIDAVVSSGAFHGAIACGEDHDLTLRWDEDFGLGLGARLLHHQDEFAAFIVHSGAAEETGQLQRKRDGSI